MTATINNSGLPAGWKSSIDEASGYPCYYNALTGESSWEKPMVTSMNPMNQQQHQQHHGRNETVLPAGWGKDHDANGAKYYYSDKGDVSWDAPAGSSGGSAGVCRILSESHARSDTVMPPGWGSDHDAEGNKFYYGANGEVQWEKPPL